MLSYNVQPLCSHTTFSHMTVRYAGSAIYSKEESKVRTALFYSKPSSINT